MPAPTATCAFTGKTLPINHLTPFGAIQPGLQQWLGQRVAGWVEGSYISTRELSALRMEYIQYLMAEDRAQLIALEEQLRANIRKEEAISLNINMEIADNRTFGERLADRIATFGGSWSFIMIFLSTLLVWMAVNTWLLGQQPFDPFPFILLNLVLSCIAALQAPVIMMSQRRQENRDRMQAENDYNVNVKAEMEVRLLHEKVDYLMTRQWQTMLDIQQAQLDMMHEMRTPPQN